MFFGDHALDTGRRELKRRGVLVPIAPQCFDLLVYLIRNHDRVVSKEHLVEAVWGGRARFCTHHTNQRGAQGNR
jgi:DNA-binding winged helix-turn-helix (wHTH) protein